MQNPKFMKAWQYGAITGGIENSLKLNTAAPIPTPKANQHLVKIHSVSLNPVDYKPAESPIFRRLVVPNPSTPGIDFSGIIVTPAKDSNLQPGDKVFGCGPSPFAGGCLAEYAVTGSNATVKIPNGVSMEDASTIGVAGLTAWQSVVPHIPKSGSKNVFLNGGSGGVGIFGIQIAKAMGCDVTVTCSERNVEMCKELGADHVIDYTKHTDLPQAIADSCKGNEFDHVVDNILTNGNLYWGAHKYSKPQAKFIIVGGGVKPSLIWETAKMKFLPGILGGGKRKILGFFAQHSNDQLKSIADLMTGSKLKAVVDSRFPFDQAPEAFKRLKTSRARGKIVVNVDDKL